MEPAPLASLDALRRAAATLSEAKALAELFEEVGDQVAQVVPYHTMRLFLLDEDTNELYPVAIRSFVEDYDLADLDNPDFRLPVGVGVTGHIAQTRVGEVVYDLESHPRAKHIPGTPRVEESFIGVPLVFRGELLGVLTVSKHGLGQFTPESLVLLEIVGVAIAASIGHRRALAAEEHARDQALRLQQLHATFIGNIGHELRTPLTTAMGFLELALKHVDAAERLPSLLRNAQRGLDRLRDLIEDLLEAVALEAGRQRLRLGTHRLGAVVDHARGRLDLEPTQVEVEGDVGALAVVDLARLSSVIAELFENAVKFGPDDGSIRVRVEAGVQQVTVDVTDEGPGIPPDEAELIFQRFTQRDPSITREHGGTGMGLALARSVARWHGGDLILLPRRPTTFRLTVPRGEPEFP